jgi:hypothetical protein
MPKYPYRELGVGFDRNFRNDLNANFDDIEADIKEVENNSIARDNDLDARIDNIVAQAGSDNTEIVDARYDSINNVTHPTLKDRLDTHANEIGILLDAGLDRISASSKFVTTMESWIGLVNTKYLSDLATRFYLLPKDRVTTGVGGALKIFGDAYHLGQDYRDLGIYFHADQNGENGYHGNGVFWINVKVLDEGIYADKHPDLGISYQDGQVVWGRWIYLPNGTKRAVLMIGSGDPIHASSNSEIGIESSKAIALQHAQKIFLYTDDPAIANSVRSQGRKVLWSLATGGGEEKYIAGVKKTDLTEQKFEVLNALVTSSRRNVNIDTSILDATGVNRIVISQPNPNTITSITGGVDGQELMIINVAPNSSPQKTTIEHNTSIKLKGGTNYAMGYNHVLTLININGTWYEKCRSENA